MSIPEFFQKRLEKHSAKGKTFTVENNHKWRKTLRLFMSKKTIDTNRRLCALVAKSLLISLEK